MAELETLEKAQPDTGALHVGDFAVQASQKVQLDIDDAPFLMSYDDPPPLPPAALQENLPELASEPDPEEVVRYKRHRKIAFWGGGIAGLLLVAGALFWYITQFTPSVEQTTIPPTIIVVPSKKSITGPVEYKIEFAPFMVEQRNGNAVRFLQAKFIGITRDEAAVAEARVKVLPLRDSIYYYLRNKTVEYLEDAANALTIKQDLLDIVNANLSKGKMEDMLLVNYIMK